MRKYIDVNLVFQILNNIPAADVVPVCRGTWKQDEWDDEDGIYRCSVCGNKFILIDGTPEMNLYNYCPNCGARMDTQAQ